LKIERLEWLWGEGWLGACGPVEVAVSDVVDAVVAAAAAAAASATAGIKTPHAPVEPQCDDVTCHSLTSVTRHICVFNFSHGLFGH